MSDFVSQAVLFADPLWTDDWSVGGACLHPLTDALGMVVAIEDGRSVRVEWTDHPRWGSHTVTYGWNSIRKIPEQALPVSGDGGDALDPRPAVSFSDTPPACGVSDGGDVPAPAPVDVTATTANQEEIPT